MMNAKKTIRVLNRLSIRRFAGVAISCLIITGGPVNAQGPVADANGPTNPTLNKVFPGKPMPGSLGTFNNSQVNYFTGAVSYNVPIFSYKSSANNLKLDIALSYNGGGGIKASQEASEVG